MKKFLIAGLFLSSTLCITQATAEENKFSLGLGSYALGLSSSDPTVPDLTFGGLALVANYEVTDLISVGGHFYSIDATEFFFSGTTLVELAYANTGYDALIKLGKNSGLGLTYFGGIGLYSETIEVSLPAFPAAGTASEDFSGTMFGAGIGHNWENVNLLLELYFRSTGDYEAGGTASVTAVTSSLNMSYRF
ncbi:MAG: hypothetical protein COB79_04080 [Zetaproteobacteria bacterium]|nr:MAG: hypothetical protein COB79_04080 [Zetaproteobacteria bacterium]